MTTRADLTETIASLIATRRPFDDTATAVLDVVLPQITTADQLPPLVEVADDTVVVGTDGTMARFQDGVLYGEGEDSWYAEDALGQFGPLTVVWQPQPERETRADA